MYITFQIYLYKRFNAPQKNALILTTVLKLELIPPEVLQNAKSYFYPSFIKPIENSIVYLIESTNSILLCFYKEAFVHFF